MSDSEDLPRDVPDREFTFFIDVEGDSTRKRFRGEFSYRIPNLKAKACADKMRASLNGGHDKHLNPTVLEFHSTISYLKFTITEAPKWWREADWGYELDDYNIVDAVYIKVEAFQKDYNEKLWGSDSDKKEEKPRKTKKSKEAEGRV